MPFTGLMERARKLISKDSVMGTAAALSAVFGLLVLLLGILLAPTTMPRPADLLQPSHVASPMPFGPSSPMPGPSSPCRWQQEGEFSQRSLAGKASPRFLFPGPAAGVPAWSSPAVPPAQVGATKHGSSAGFP